LIRKAKSLVHPRKNVFGDGVLETVFVDYLEVFDVLRRARRRARPCCRDDVPVEVVEGPEVELFPFCDISNIGPRLTPTVWAFQGSVVVDPGHGE
jgi:hypothetical protein